MAHKNIHAEIMQMNSGECERDTLMRDVWGGFPFVFDVFTDRINSDRDHDMRKFCRASFGREAFLGKDGVWQRGGATVNGWTWFGFQREEDAQAFLSKFQRSA